MAKKSSNRESVSRNKARDLDIEIRFLEGLLRRDPSYVDALQVLGDDYTRRGRFNEGLQVDEQLVRLRPQDPLTHYNLACSYSLTEQLQESAQSLERAINLGYRDFQWMSRDPDLAPLRQNPLYKRIQEKVRSIKVRIG